MKILTASRLSLCPATLLLDTYTIIIPTVQYMYMYVPASPYIGTTYIRLTTNQV